MFFVARGAHRDAIAKNGLKIESVLGDLHLPKPNVTDDPAKVGPVDIVLFAVKLWDTEKAAEQARPLVGETTRVITAERHRQRGAHRSHSGRRADRGGAAYIATVIAAPGVIKQTSQFAMMRFGRADKEPDATLKAFVNAGKAAKVDLDITPDIQKRELWQKFIFLTAMSGSTPSLRSRHWPDPR